MEPNNDAKSAAVAALPKQAEASQAPVGWVERYGWTARRLPRLAARASADRVWFSLLDKTYSPATLASSWHKVWRKGGSAGADAQTVGHCARHSAAELSRLSAQLRDGT